MEAYNSNGHNAFVPGNEPQVGSAVPDCRPDHSFVEDLCQACSQGQLDEFKRLVTQWKSTRLVASAPPGPQLLIATLEPVLCFAIRQHQTQIVSYLLDEGMEVSVLAEVEAADCKCDSSMWEVFLNHGWDINNSHSAADAPALGWVFYDIDVVRWFLSHGADPNAEARYGWTPWLRAVVWAPLEIVKLLHEAGGRLDLAVPYVCFGLANRRNAHKYPDRLEVLRYLLDNGADINARMWSHNHYGRSSHFDCGSALNIALLGGQDEIAEELLSRGARTDIAAEERLASNTALEYAKQGAPHLLPKVEDYRRRELPEEAKKADSSSP
ncbi:ankyrin repeat protein [Colletotrichum truncatum]|uniref:Ankyrin repeat protein n=1 Tax=Colletotrichum truncatum TaxID=5467 RepID=A0ACC3ZD37_COLTU|nr:ankyrin repeat protein [Colletotrichum truncatum]KAF6797999.1 ankyrin repeat protein [Colletotrichum truncatum]